MDLHQLRAFCEVAKQRSFSGAAKALFLSQPAVSRQIASLESEIGMSLFTRMGNNISLTDPGRRLLSYAEDIIQKLEQATRSLKDLQNLQAGTVTVAADAYLSQYVLPRYVTEFHRRYPGLQLRFLTCPQQQLTEILAEGKADVAFFCGEPSEAALLTQEKLFDEQLYFVAPQPVRSDISTHVHAFGPFIFPPEFSSFGEEYQRVLPEALTRENSAIVLDTLEGIKTSLQNGCGCSILPENLIQQEIGQGSLFAVPIGISCPVILTYPKDFRLPHPVLLFLGIVRKSLHRISS